MIPISVIIAVKNEALNIPYSLPPLLNHFSDVVVVDSHSTDNTAEIARNLGAKVISFQWNGQYPKKRQWCLDNLNLRYDWVLMIDADEIITDEFIHELKMLDHNADGYFICSRMTWNHNVLRHGLYNKKLCLFKKSKFHFPHVNDLGFQGMGEIEGHYQPISHHKNTKIKCLKSFITHHNRKNNWYEKHHNYCRWEVAMNVSNAWPIDPVPHRQFLKSFLRRSYLRPIFVFIFGYVLRLGFCDGLNGLDYAIKRAAYTYHIVHATRQTIS